MPNNFTEFPEDFIKIIDQNGDSVTIVIHDIFDGEAEQVAVHYHEDVVTEICDYKDTGITAPITVDAFCYGLDAKFTEISIAVYFGSNAHLATVVMTPLDHPINLNAF